MSIGGIRHVDVSGYINPRSGKWVRGYRAKRRVRAPKSAASLPSVDETVGWDERYEVEALQWKLDLIKMKRLANKGEPFRLRGIHSSRRPDIVSREGLDPTTGGGILGGGTYASLMDSSGGSAQVEVYMHRAGQYLVDVEVRKPIIITVPRGGEDFDIDIREEIAKYIAKHEEWPIWKRAHLYECLRGFRSIESVGGWESLLSYMERVTDDPDIDRTVGFSTKAPTYNDGSELMRRFLLVLGYDSIIFVDKNDRHGDQHGSQIAILEPSRIIKAKEARNQLVSETPEVRAREDALWDLVHALKYGRDQEKHIGEVLKTAMSTFDGSRFELVSLDQIMRREVAKMMPDSGSVHTDRPLSGKVHPPCEGCGRRHKGKCRKKDYKKAIEKALDDWYEDGF